MRVALLNPCYWPEVRRGSERLAHDLAGGLRARGHEVQLLTSHRARPTRTVEDGVEVVRSWRPPQGRLLRRGYETYLTHVPFSALELRRSGPDVANALYPTDALAALRWGGPTVFSYMGVPHRRYLAARRRRLEITLRAAQESDAVVALSEVAADGFRRWLGIEPRVIAPSVDLDAFRPGEEERAEDPTILFAGDLRQPQKRVGLLLEAFAEVRRSRPSARLLLSRPSEGMQEAPAEGVELLDLDDRSALAAANRRAWVAALPSVGEAFGLVLVEALACGTPVVGPSAEIVDRPEIGRVFAGDDPAVLAAALLEALDLTTDPGTSAACRARAEDFSPGAAAAAYEALYDEVRARRG